MGVKGKATRENILRISQQLMLEKGFSGTTLEEIISDSNITKGGFFYHFESKDDLAKHLMLQYQKDDEIFFSGLFARADELSEDPLQQMLIFLKLLSEAMNNLPGLHPGCLVATFTSANQLMNQAVKDVTADCLISWREMFKARLDIVNQKYTPRSDVTTTDLADMLSTIMEGGIIISRALCSQKLLVNQLLMFRNFLRLLYSDE